MAYAVGLLIIACVIVFVMKHSRIGGHTNSALSVRIVTPQAAARRALCLGAIVSRAFISEEAVATADGTNAGVSTLEPECDKIVAWLKAEGLWESLSASECTIMNKPIGTWSKQELIDAEWRSEALNVLFWALGLQPEMLPYDRQEDPATMASKLGILSRSTGFIERAQLRSKAEITKARSIAELWLWRARTTKLQKNGTQPPQGFTFEEIIAITAEAASKDGVFIPIQNDFPAFGRPYSQLTDDELSFMTSIASERLYASNWLCGLSKDWDTVRTDT